MRILFNLLPGLVNIISGLFMFISAKRMADSQASHFMVAATMAVWALFYALTAFVLGRFLTKRNAVKILLAGQTVLLISLTGLALTDNAVMQYFWLCGTGIGTSSFFTAFQAVVKLFGKQEYELGSVAKNTAVYTLSWSFGLASGPLLAAFVWGLFDPKEGWRYCYFIAIGMVLFNIICLLLMNRFVKARLRELGEEAGNPVPPEIPPEQAKLPDLIIASWGAAVFAGCVVAMMRTYIPDYCTDVLKWDTYKQGMILALFSYSQAFTGLFCWKARRWPYRPWVFAGAALCGIVAMALFLPDTPNWHVCLIGACLLGIFYGVFYFTSTFHALINPVKSARYAAGNETIVGLTSTLAPIFGGLLATLLGPRFPFQLCIGLIAGSALFFAAGSLRAGSAEK
ncbi:MAG: MFS transporter [Lentisphaeria bacterium]|nr:MFS transporter [Lentisphaeria bacterium]